MGKGLRSCEIHFKNKKRRLNDSVFSMESAGRWSILNKTETDRDPLCDDNLEKIQIKKEKLIKHYSKEINILNIGQEDKKVLKKFFKKKKKKKSAIRFKE